MFFVSLNLTLNLFNRIFPNLKIFKCTSKYLKYYFTMLIEICFIDIIFYTTFNLVSDYEQYSTDARVFGKFISIIMFSNMIYHYLNMAINVLNNPKAIEEYDQRAVFFGLSSKRFRPERKYLNLLNIIFKLKIILLLVIMVIFQPYPSICLVSALILQSLSMINLIYLSKKHSKMFSGKIALANTILVEMTLFLLFFYTLLVVKKEYVNTDT